MAAKGKTNGSSFPAWDATKIWTNLNWPNLDVASLVKAQQKNIDAINMVTKSPLRVEQSQKTDGNLAVCG